MVENNELPDDPKRWTATRKATVVIEIIKGRTTPSEVSRTYGLAEERVESWISGFINSGTEGLSSRLCELRSKYNANLGEAMARIGELSRQIEELKSSLPANKGASGRQLLKVHLDEIRDSGKSITLTKLCRLLDVSRSVAYYRPRQRKRNDSVDESMCQIISEIATLHPTYGIRRIWAMLRQQYGLVVNKKKVARIMRIKRLTIRGCAGRQNTDSAEGRSS